MESTKQTKTVDQLIAEIAEVLSEADGEFISDVANQVLSYRYKYIGDSTFELVTCESILAEDEPENGFIRFEYDPDYFGGEYNKTGQFALVPIDLCAELGNEEAFEKRIGLDKVHIIHFSPDEVYGANGEIMDDEK
jgi:hypothetical protein